MYLKEVIHKDEYFMIMAEERGDSRAKYRSLTLIPCCMFQEKKERKKNILMAVSFWANQNL